MKIFFILICLLGLSGISHAQGIYFISTNVKGFSAGFKGAVDVNAFANGTACQACTVDGQEQGGGAAKITPGKIIFSVSGDDPAINTLRQYLLTGSVQTATATLVFTKKPASGGILTGYYYIQLKDFTVLEIDQSAAGSEDNLEISLGYQTIVWGTKTPKTDGSYGTTINKIGWNFVTNTAFNTLVLPLNVN